MAFSAPTETKASFPPDTTVSVTLSATPSAGSLIVASLGVKSAEPLPTINAPSGFTFADKFETANHTHAVYSKVSDGTEGTLTFSNGSTVSDIGVIVSVYPSAGGGAFAGVSDKQDNGLNTNSISLGPVTCVAGDLLIASNMLDASSVGTVSWSNGFSGTANLSLGNPRMIGGYKIAVDTSEDTVHTVDSTVTYNAGTLLVFRETATTPTIRKGSQFTVDKPGSLGTITTATLNAVNVFDHLTAQDATTATFAGAVTDEITTSGGYSLVLGDGATTETITVQVNVVGLPIYNLNKDGADLASLADVEVIVMTGVAGSRVINQNTASEVTGVSGNTVAYEVTDTALTVDQNVFVVIHSAAGTVGIAFTETLELI